jgi:hypothetical protein
MSTTRNSSMRRSRPEQPARAIATLAVLVAAGIVVADCGRDDTTLGSAAPDRGRVTESLKSAAPRADTRP